MPGMDDSDMMKYRKLLEKERTLLEHELSELGVDPGNSGDWTPKKPEGDEFGADRNDNADIIEDMTDDNAAASELSGRLKSVVGALNAMDDGTYGLCDVCGADIESDRLAANPAATTCKKHMN